MGGLNQLIMQLKHSALKTLFIAAIVFAFAACKNAAEVPLPDEPKYPQPIIRPLQFSAEKKIDWSDSTTNVQPTVKKFDLNKVPSKLFNVSGFTPFEVPPEEVSFNLDKLPDTVFNYDKLPSQPLQFET